VVKSVLCYTNGMSLIPLYTDLDEARRTILRRDPPPPVPDDVARIVADVRARGDDALREWSLRLDGYDPDAEGAPPLLVADEEIIEAYDRVPSEVVEALEQAAERVFAFHSRQPAASWMVEDQDGLLGQFVRPLARVGLYTPTPSALLMCALPARAAGVEDIVACAPPGPGGALAPELLVAADVAQAPAVYRLGGAQAIAALAYGTASIPRVDKLAGPGDAPARQAGRAVAGAAGVDGLWGAGETLIVADADANPQWIAADLLAQAERGAQAAALLLTPDRALAEAVQAALGDAGAAYGGAIVLTGDLAEALALADEYAPARLCLAVRDPWSWAPRARRAGAVFLGEHNHPALGDYVAGPGPLSVWDFVRLTGFAAMAPDDAREWGVIAEVLARAEGAGAAAKALARRREG
jgi:histidinol dehydrogenase